MCTVIVSAWQAIPSQIPAVTVQIRCTSAQTNGGGIPLERRGVPGVPAENRRQDIEPSHHFLVYLNTGLLKDYVVEMSRRPSGCKCVCVCVCERDGVCV